MPFSSDGIHTVSTNKNIPEKVCLRKSNKTTELEETIKFKEKGGNYRGNFRPDKFKSMDEFYRRSCVQNVLRQAS